MLSCTGAEAELCHLEFLARTIGVMVAMVIVSISPSENAHIGHIGRREKSLLCGVLCSLLYVRHCPPHGQFCKEKYMFPWVYSLML